MKLPGEMDGWLHCPMKETGEYLEFWEHHHICGGVPAVAFHAEDGWVFFRIGSDKREKAPSREEAALKALAR